MVNGLFALAIPVGAALFFVTAGVDGPASNVPSSTLSWLLAFSAGMFLCISMSDLLPELQFHQHDRIKLSVALLAGLLVAYAAGRLAHAVGGHDHPSIIDRQLDAQVGASSPPAPKLKLPCGHPVDHPRVHPTTIFPPAILTF